MRNVKRASQLLAHACSSSSMNMLFGRTQYAILGANSTHCSTVLSNWTESTSHSRITRAYAAKKAKGSEDPAVPKERKRRASSKSSSDQAKLIESQENVTPTQDVQPSDLKSSRDLTEEPDIQKMKELILSQTFEREPGLATIASLGKADPRGKGGKNEIKLLRNVVDALLTLNKHRVASQETGLANYLNFNTISLPLSLAEQSNAAEMLNTLLRDTYLRYELLKGKSIRNSVRSLAYNRQCCSAMVSASKMKPRSI